MYSVNVGNVGTVFTGSSPIEAQREYGQAIEASKAAHGRASGEVVSLFRDGELVREFDPNAGFYFVEFTDTFGGEANYCWARRYKVKASTYVGAIRKAAADMGYSGRMRKDWDSGSDARYNVRGACVCAFVSYFDKDAHGDYTLQVL